MALQTRTYIKQKKFVHVEKSHLLHDPLKVFWLAGLHPSGMDFLPGKMLVLFYIIGAIVILTLATKGIMVFYETDMFFMVECIYTCILMLHASGKILNVYVHRTTIITLLEMYSKFWKICDFKGDLKEEYTKVHTIIRTLVHRYFLMTAVCILFFIFKPPSAYIPKGWKLYITIYHALVFYGMALTVVATDGLFCLLGVSITVQFKLLGYKFRNINVVLSNGDSKQDAEILWHELRKLVDHHNFLFSFCELTNQVFNVPFLIQFLASNGSAAISIFILTQGGSLTNTLKFLMLSIILISQTVFYCLPAEFIKNAADEISTDVYESPWNETNVIQFKKCLTNVLARSQKVITFSASGLVFINLRTLVLISKTAFSFYTYLSSIKKLK